MNCFFALPVNNSLQRNALRVETINADCQCALYPRTERKLIYETFRPQLAAYGGFRQCPHRGDNTDCAHMSTFNAGPGELPEEFTARISIWGGEVCNTVDIKYPERPCWKGAKTMNLAAFARAIETHTCRIEIDPVIGDTLHFKKRT